MAPPSISTGSSASTRGCSRSKPFWDNRALAIVHACGSPDATRSHFDAQDYMETATPGVKSTPDGWLNRLVRRIGAPALGRFRRASATWPATPFRAVALTQQLPRMLQGTAPALAMNQIGQFGIRGGQAAGTMGASFEAQYAAAADRVLNGTGREAFDAIKMLKVADPARYQPDNGADYPRSPFGQALKQIGQLTKAGVGLEVAFADVGGWDTHVNQGSSQGQLANRLDDFSRSLAALVTDLGSRMADTVILTMSEFGRAVGENGNRGTDHGHGNAMMVIGGGVRGGKVYGTWPGSRRGPALRRARPRRHHRFPRRLRRGGRPAPGRQRCAADLPRLCASARNSGAVRKHDDQRRARPQISGSAFGL